MDPDAPGTLAEVTGTVAAILPRALYRVDVGRGQAIVAHAPGGAGRNYVRLVVGDRVRVVVSPHDAARGRIVGKQ